MSSGKRRTRQSKRQPALRTARAKPRIAQRRAATKRRRATTKRHSAASAKRMAAAQKRAVELFDQQIHAVWTRFGQECLQFAEGFNTEIGSQQLEVESNPDTVVARFAVGGEILVQLDREQKHIGCWISSNCGGYGSCVVEQPPLGLIIEDDRLRFVYGESPMSEDNLAARLMTDLIQADTPPAERSIAPPQT
jgi:hypothetical protein